MITRPLAQATEMVRLLEARGAIPYLFPVIETVMVEDLSELERALEQIHAYDWLVFTSVNAVKYFFQYLEQVEGSWSGKQERVSAFFKHLKIAAIGSKTADALAVKGLEVSQLPQAYVQEALVDFFKRKAKPGERVLFPKAEYTRELLIEELEANGLQIEGIPIYRTKPIKQENAALLEKLRRQEIDVLTFTSSSTVRSFMSNFLTGKEQEDARFKEYLAEIVIASIGPITTRTAIELGLNVQVEATTYTITGLVDALEVYYQDKHMNI